MLLVITFQFILCLALYISHKMQSLILLNEKINFIMLKTLKINFPFKYDEKLIIKEFSRRV